MARQASQSRCTYAVAIEERCYTTPELQELSRYFGSLRAAGCEVLVIDGSSWDVLEDHQRVLRWVARHHRVEPRHRSIDGRISIIDAALDLATTDPIIVASEEHRLDPAAINAICRLMESHDVVATHEFFTPLPWWGRIEAARTLLLRSFGPGHDPSSAFAFKRAPLRQLRQYAGNGLWDDGEPLHDFTLQGLDVHDASDLFIERRPPAVGRWWSDRSRRAHDELEATGRAMLAFAILPIAVLVTLFGGSSAAAGFAAFLSAIAVVLALRGRSGAARYFPAAVCLFAPLAIFDRAVGVYGSVIRRVVSAAWVRSEPAIPPRLIQRSTRKHSASR
jgi:hypothetical protein